jgi:hypothetical protein
MECLDNLDEFVANWIAHHTKYMIEGEVAETLIHYNTVDLREHGYRVVPYQPVHRRREDTAERDQLNRLTGSSPLLAWDIIRRIVAATADPEILAGLSCPLDLLLTRHGPTIIASLEEHAKLDSRLRDVVVRVRGEFEIFRTEGSREVHERLMSV